MMSLSLICTKEDPSELARTEDKSGLPQVCAIDEGFKLHDDVDQDDEDDRHTVVKEVPGEHGHPVVTHCHPTHKLDVLGLGGSLPYHKHHKR